MARGLTHPPLHHLQQFCRKGCPALLYALGAWLTSNPLEWRECRDECAWYSWCVPPPPFPQGLPEASPAHRERVEDIFLGGQRTRRHSNDGYPSHSNSFEAHTWHSGNGNTGVSVGSASAATGAHHHSNSAAGDEGSEHRRLHQGWAISAQRVQPRLCVPIAI